MKLFNEKQSGSEIITGLDKLLKNPELETFFTPEEVDVLKQLPKELLLKIGYTLEARNDELGQLISKF